MNGMEAAAAAAARVWGDCDLACESEEEREIACVEETKGGGGIAELIRGGSGLGSCRVGPGLDLAAPPVLGRVGWVPRVSLRESGSSTSSAFAARNETGKDWTFFKPAGDMHIVFLYYRLE